MSKVTPLSGGSLEATGSDLNARRIHPGLATTATAIWWLVALAFGALLVARSFGLPAFGEAFPKAWAYLSPQGALVLVACSSIVGVTVSQLSPANTLRALGALSAFVLLLAAVSLGDVGGLLSAAGVSLLACVTGIACLQLAGVSTRSSLANGALATALGYAIIGTIAFCLAYAGFLSSTGLLIAGFSLLVLSLFAITRSQQPIPQIWGTVTPLSGVEAFLVGATTGIVTFALLSALTPENMFDPFRQHLPIAAEFWNRGSLEVIPHLGVSRDPVMGLVLFAIAFGFGGIPAATLVHASMGLIASLAVAGAASLIGSQRAAIFAGLTFATMPLLLFEIGHAFTDLFPAAFAAGASICILEWITNRRMVLLVLAGALCGAGIAAKLTTIWVSLAFAIVILLVGSASSSFRERLVGVLAFSAGNLIAIPWLARTILASGGVPGKVLLLLGFVVDRVPGLSGMIAPQAEPGFQPVDVTNAGIGHAPWDIATVPWLMAFHSDRFPDFTLGGGDIGLLIPLLLPTAFLVSKDRKWWALVVASLVMYLSWWITPQQVSRHLLPTLALLAVLCGLGAARVTQIATRWPSAARLAVYGALIAGLLGSISLFANNRYSQVPIALVVGQISAEEYVDKEIPAARELRVASATLAPDAPLLYVGRRGGAQLYSDARIVNAGQFTQELVDEQFGVSDQAVLDALDALGTTEILWDREVTKPEDWSSHLLSLGFLSRHARILDGSDGYLLFELTPDADRYWNLDPSTSLMLDPAFGTVRRKISPWNSELRLSRTNGAIAPRRDSVVSQAARVTPGTPYLMVANVSCPELWSRTTLTMRWLDAEGSEVSRTSQTVFAFGPFADRFIWAVAPDTATSVSVEFGGQSRCEFSRVDLFAQPVAQ